jgi:hypothetical protein
MVYDYTTNQVDFVIIPGRRFDTFLSAGARPVNRTTEAFDNNGDFTP